jgi:hypothetical protein
MGGIMKRIVPYLLLAALILTTLACGSSTASMQQAVTQISGASTQAQHSGDMPTQAPPVQVQVTDRPTYTPAPTNTTGPTDTPEPTFTPTPAPQPIELTGTGSKVINLSKWNGPAVVHLVYKGSRNFMVDSLDADGENTSFMGMVNEIGAYDGWKPLDFGMWGKEVLTTRFQIQSSGEWTITVYPLELQYLKTAQVPGTYEGKGDEVVLLQGGQADVATFDYKGERNFMVDAISTDGSQDGIVNEIGAYNGQVVMPKESTLIVVTASGPWTVEFTAK